MHDDDGLRPEFTRVVIRHFPKAVNVRELLHSTLDRLLDMMFQEKETKGCVSVTSMDPEPAPFAGHTLVIGLDLDAQPEDYEGLDESEGQ